jgi:SAM-dependent methyltransferase
MLQRFKEIIRREKLIHPKGIGVLLLLKAIYKSVARRLSYKTLRYKMVAITKNGSFYGEEQMRMCSLFPQETLDIILAEANPQSILDIGCGTGQSLDYFIQKGIDAWGIENSSMAIKLSLNPKKIFKYNLNKKVDLKRRFDLVWSFEVIEHIHPDYEANFLKTLTKHSDLVILSAAQPHQGGFGHFNEQPQEYWIDKFQELGYTFNKPFSEKLQNCGALFSENMMVFCATK